ncbi:cell division protein ZapE [Thioalkalicoccus limnaeus]|uniref:Cell division protein ZapE n=1 Tax=Thioalkalicoccus limnaeus TaxID=120681 RepID=A0ABV4BDF6_9GAMM
MTRSKGSTPGLVPFDAAQREVAERFRALHARLIATPARRQRTGWLGFWPSSPATPVTGLYLWGAVGRGKTYLMDWFVEALPVADTRRLHFHHFMGEVHEALARLPKQPDPLEVVADQWRRSTRVLCLDEFLVNDIADAMILAGLLRALFARGVTLVTTANTPPRELYRDGLQRTRFEPAIALLERHTEVIELGGDTDYRLRALSQTDIYLVSGGDATEAVLENWFRQLSGGHETSERTLSVHGREIPVRRLARDLAWFDFETLCGTGRGTADYIEIAEVFHTVIVSGVPELGPRHEAAARRFLHLVDTFYDRRIRLILSAAVPLARLYAGGLDRFPEQRLLSRLAEMQSAAYLANSHATA